MIRVEGLLKYTATAGILMLCFAGCAPKDLRINPSPEQIVQSFYDAYLKTAHSGLPSREDMLILKPYLASTLVSRIEAARIAQKKYMTDYPEDKPPFIEGDLFSSLFEGPSEYEIFSSDKKENAARILVKFIFIDSEHLRIDWRDEVHLILENKSWRISDIHYRGEWDFATRGFLSGNLGSILNLPD